MRVDNILRGERGFVLIDWELASHTGDLVFWQATAGRLPPGVGVGTKWLACMDLWQLGSNLLRYNHLMTPESHGFLTKLMNGELDTAEEALASMIAWV